MDNLVNSKAITYKTLISVLYDFTKNCEIMILYHTTHMISYTAGGYAHCLLRIDNITFHSIDIFIHNINDVSSFNFDCQNSKATIMINSSQAEEDKGEQSQDEQKDDQPKEEQPTPKDVQGGGDENSSDDNITQSS